MFIYLFTLSFSLIQISRDKFPYLFPSYFYLIKQNIVSTIFLLYFYPYFFPLYLTPNQTKHKAPPWLHPSLMKTPLWKLWDKHKRDSIYTLLCQLTDQEVA